MNKYNIIVSAKATDQMVNHVAFLANVSSNAANRLIDSFEETVRSL